MWTFFKTNEIDWSIRMTIQNYYIEFQMFTNQVARSAISLELMKCFIKRKKLSSNTQTNYDMERYFNSHLWRFMVVSCVSLEWQNLEALQQLLEVEWKLDSGRKNIAIPHNKLLFLLSSWLVKVESLRKKKVTPWSVFVW